MLASYLIDIEQLLEEQLSTAPGGNMQGSKLGVVKAQKWKGTEWTVLEESSPDLGILVRYFIDPKSYVIWRTQIKNPATAEIIFDGWLTQLEILKSLARSDVAESGIHRSDLCSRDRLGTVHQPDSNAVGAVVQK